jgi:hypothetical protein
MCICVSMNRIHPLEYPRNCSSTTSSAAISTATEAHAGCNSGLPCFEYIWIHTGTRAAMAIARIVLSLNHRAPNCLGRFFSRYQTVAASASATT